MGGCEGVLIFLILPNIQNQENLYAIIIVCVQNQKLLIDCWY